MLSDMEQLDRYLPQSIKVLMWDGRMENRVVNWELSDIPVSEEFSIHGVLSSGEGVQTGERLKAAYELDENTYGEKFNAEWKLIAQESPEGFLRLQHSYTKARYYDVLVEKLEK